MVPDPRVAVVVATHNRLRTLLRTLEHLGELPERPHVVVVDNASGDGTAQAVREQHPGVELIELAENVGAGALTVGARAVAAPFVAFSDDDSWWAPGALALAADVLERHPNLALVAARILVGGEQREDPTCAAMAASPLGRRDGIPGPAVLGFVACGSVVRRKAFLEAGGFDPRVGVYGEERLLAVELALRGWELTYVPEVVAHHHPSEDRDLDRRRRLETRNALWFAWLRRRAWGAAHATLGVLTTALRDPAARSGVLDALRGASWVLRERRPVSHELELDLRALGG